MLATLAGTLQPPPSTRVQCLAAGEESIQGGRPSKGPEDAYEPSGQIIGEQAADEAVFTEDVGTPTVWAARYLKMNGRRRLIGSFVHGSMTNALQGLRLCRLAFGQLIAEDSIG